MSGSLTIGIHARFKANTLAASLLFPLPSTYGFLPAILFQAFHKRRFWLFFLRSSYSPYTLRKNVRVGNRSAVGWGLAGWSLARGAFAFPPVLSWP